MDWVKEFGFQYYITGIKDGKFGIKDLEDLCTEYYTLEEVLEISKTINIKGVENDSVKLDWFFPYYLKMMTLSDAKGIPRQEFHEKFGIAFVKTSSGKEFLRLVLLSNLVTYFIEFVNSFMLVYPLNLSPSTLDFPVKEFFEVQNGVGFKYIKELVFSIQSDCLSTINFDEYTYSSDKVVTINVKGDVFHNTGCRIEGAIQSSRRIDLSYHVYDTARFGKFTTNGGKIQLNVVNEANCIITRDFLNSDVFESIAIKNYSSTIFIIEDESMIKDMVKKGVVRTSFNYKLLSEYENNKDNRDYHICEVISGLNKSKTIKMDSKVNHFVFKRKVKLKIIITKAKLEYFKQETDFVKRHNISLIDFVALCEIV